MGESPRRRVPLRHGFTQAGSSPNTLLVGNDAVYKVEIDGSGLTNDLFRILASGSTIRGLLINRVPGVSIQIDGGEFSR